MTTVSLKTLTATHFIQKWSVFVLFLVCFMFRVGLCDNVGDTLEEESAHFDVKPGGKINVYTRDWVRVVISLINSLILFKLHYL